jgi:hypothetical protein
MDGSMLCSLVVVTTDRLLLVERLFHSFVSQRCQNFEVLFVHGKACTEEMRALTERFGQSLTIKTFVSPSDSVSVARNVPLRAAAGDIVAFPDDDCVYSPETLQTVCGIFGAHPETDVLLGARARLNIRQEVRHRASLEISRVKSRYEAFRNSETFLQFYRRRCLETVGPFDEALGPGTGLPYGSGEDTDYVLRAFAAGFAVFRAPGVGVAHPDPPLGDPELLSKAKAYAVGRMRLLQKHSMPLWFEAANILYPLCRIPLDCLPVFRFRWTIFQARLAASVRNRMSGRSL